MIKTGFLKTEDDRDIAYKHYLNDKSKVVLIVHGFYNSKDSELLTLLAEELSAVYDVFMFDFRGHGKSSGLFTWSSEEKNDLNAVLDHLRAKYTKTAIIAFSLGGTTSINTLADNKHKVDSFICVSAPSDCSKIEFKWWKLDLENDIQYSLLTKEGRKGKGARPGPFWLNKEKPIDKVHLLKMPVFYIHGEKDWVVGKWHSEALYDKTIAEKEIVIIPKAPHAEYLLRTNKEEFFTLVNEWFIKTL